MKLPLFLIATMLFTACQQDNASDVEQKRQELEAKRKELQDKKEMANLKQELKSVESEISTVDGVKPSSNESTEIQGKIRGQSVSLRAANSAQSAKLAVLTADEPVKIISKKISVPSNEAIINQAVTISEYGQSFALPKGKSLLIQDWNHDDQRWYVSFTTPEETTVYTMIDKNKVDRMDNKYWFQVRRQNGTTGWVLGDFLIQI